MTLTPYARFAKGSQARVRTFLGLVAVTAALAFPITPGAAQVVVPPTAPENLRCAGVPVPPPPGPGWQVQPVWDWRDVVHVEGVTGSSDGPYAVALDRACNVYVTDSQHFQVLKLSPDGNVVARWALPGTRAAGESSSPRGVAVDGQGNVYVTDTPRDRVYKLSPQGAVLATWGACTPGSGPPTNKYCDPKAPGLFIGPEGIAVDGAGNVFVSEAAGGRIQKLSTDGASKAVWDMKDRTASPQFILGNLALDQAGFLYLTDGYNNQVLKLDPSSGAVVGRWGGPDSGSGPAQFHGPLGVGVDRDGDMYVSDAQNWRVQKLAPNGSFLDQWRNCLDGPDPCQFPDAGSDLGQFFASRGVALDGQGTVYVADTGNKRVQRLMIVDFTLIPPPDNQSAPEDQS